MASYRRASSFCGQTVQLHPHDSDVGTHGRAGCGRGPKHEEARENQEDALERTTHGVGHGVHAAQAPEGRFICNAMQPKRGGGGGKPNFCSM